MYVHQVCLLPMLLQYYNIAVEVLANLINADKRIKGIQIGDHEIKIVIFTDNTVSFLRDITWETFKKYIHSRFLSFEPSSLLVRFCAIPRPLQGTFVLVRIHPATTSMLMKF